MKPFLVGGLLIGGAYFLLRDNIAAFLNPSSPAAAAPADPSATPKEPAASSAAATGTLAKLKASIAAAGQASILTTVAGPDTWNYFLMAANPALSAPAPEVIWPDKANPREPVTIDVWFTAIAPFLTSSGLAGVRPVTPMKRRAGREAWS